MRGPRRRPGGSLNGLGWESSSEGGTSRQAGMDLGSDAHRTCPRTAEGSKGKRRTPECCLLTHTAVDGLEVSQPCVVLRGLTRDPTCQALGVHPPEQPAGEAHHDRTRLPECVTVCPPRTSAPRAFPAPRRHKRGQPVPAPQNGLQRLWGFILFLPLLAPQRE